MGVTPSHHPFLHGFFHEIEHCFWSTPIGNVSDSCWWLHPRDSDHFCSLFFIKYPWDQATCWVHNSPPRSPIRLRHHHAAAQPTRSWRCSLGGLVQDATGRGCSWLRDTAHCMIWAQHGVTNKICNGRLCKYRCWMMLTTGPTSEMLLWIELTHPKMQGLLAPSFVSCMGPVSGGEVPEWPDQPQNQRPIRQQDITKQDEAHGTSHSYSRWGPHSPLKMWRKTRESADSPPATVDIFFLHSQHEMLKTQRFFRCFIFGKHLESVILYCVGQLKIKKFVFRVGETMAFWAPWGKKVWKCLLF